MGLAGLLGTLIWLVACGASLIAHTPPILLVLVGSFLLVLVLAAWWTGWLKPLAHKAAFWFWAHRLVPREAACSFGHNLR